MPKIWVGLTMLNGEKKEDGLSTCCKYLNQILVMYSLKSLLVFSLTELKSNDILSE